MMNNLSIDLETRSSVDLPKSGVYRYAESEDFAVLLFGVSVDHGPVRVYDLARGETLPPLILSALVDDAVEKWAYNSSFERICLSVWLRRYHPELFSPPGEDLYLSPASWRCSLVLGAYNGYPLGLEMIGAALGLDEQKLKEGKDLIRFFCSPSRVSGHIWNLPEHAPEKWDLFKRYNERDVQVELQIQERLRAFPVPDTVWREYALDQRINDRGIRVDRTLVRQAICLEDLSRADLSAKMRRLSGIGNPNSVIQLKQYLQSQGLQVDALGKEEVEKQLPSVSGEVKEVLSLRLQLARSSVRKYQTMADTVGSDDRCRGLFQFYGASRTGRWAGRLIQLQNLPQNHMEDLLQARALVKQGDYEMLTLLYDSVPDVLSQLIRTALVPRQGCRFIVADYSAIEARVLSFLAGEQWRLEVFHAGRDIYCESASRMFRCVVEKHGRNSHLRQRGKIAELALGYGGSVGALSAMGAVRMGIPEEDLKPLVNLWRQANPNIVRYWWQIDEAAKTAVRDLAPTSVGAVRFGVRGGVLFAELPSGRHLAYVHPRLEENRFGGQSITYMGTDAQKRWSRLETYGPKLVENLTQAICRDILADAMNALSAYRIVAHVHDEVILEVPRETSLEQICAVMGQPPPWLPGIELRADGFEAEFYRK